MINLSRLRHAYPERDGLIIDRPNGYGEYTFLHFFQSVDILIGGELIKTEPNAVIIYDKFTPQYFKTEQPLIHNWLHISGDLPQLAQRYGIETDTLYYPANPSFITELVYEIEFEFFGSRENRDLLLQLKFEELLLKLSRAVKGQGAPVLGLDRRTKFQELRLKMFSDFSKHYTTEEMAASVGLSQSRFYSTYKAIYGISPTSDIINGRLEKAKDMLFYEKKSVNEISEELGYENVSHFIRQFKSRTGFSPTQYRRKKV